MDSLTLLDDFQTKENLIDIKQNPDYLKSIKNITFDVAITAIELKPSLIEHMELMEGILLEKCYNESKDLKELIDKEKIIKQNIQKLRLLAVKKDGLSLRYISRQTEDVCIEAVKQNANSICFIREDLRSEYIYIIATRKDPKILKDINGKYLTFNLCIEPILKGVDCPTWINSSIYNKLNNSYIKHCILMLKLSQNDIEETNDDYDLVVNIFSVIFKLPHPIL